jgi:membrane-associated phospholipid phosphatase
MRRYLLVALWPAGMAAIAAAAAVAARRAPASPIQPVAKNKAEPVLPAAGTEGFGAPPAFGPHNGVKPADPIANGVGALDPGSLDWLADSEPGLPEWLPDLVKLGAISVAGGIMSYRLMELIGRPVIEHGPKIDYPIERWTRSHQVAFWATIVERLNKIGNTWTIWGGAGTAAACLATSWRRQKWLPPSVLAAAVLVDKYATLALRRRFRRAGPPGSPGGTYPAGGPDRIVLFSGLIANLLWREFSGSQRGKALALGLVGGLAFNQAYCREYLSKHWFTDIICGLLYGVVLYAPFAFAIRLIAGPPTPAPAGDTTTEATPWPATLKASVRALRPSHRFTRMSA